MLASTSTADANQIRDGSLNLCGWVGFLKYVFATLMCKHVCAAIYAPGIRVRVRVRVRVRASKHFVTTNEFV